MNRKSSLRVLPLALLLPTFLVGCGDKPVEGDNPIATASSRDAATDPALASRRAEKDASRPGGGGSPAGKFRRGG